MATPLKKVGKGLVYFMVLMFQVATGFSAVIISGIIDPVLINELGVPALLVGVLLGAHFLSEPIRVYVGSFSDRVAIFKLHRAPFIALGGIILAASYPLMVLVVEQLRNPAYHHVAGVSANTGNYQVNPLWLIVALVVFFINGTGISIMGTMALSVIVDTTTERVRGIIASIGWTLLIVGIIVGSIVSKVILPDTEGVAFDYKTLYPIFFFVIPGVLLSLVTIAVIASIIIEPRREGAVDKVRTHVSFQQALKVISKFKQARWFFFFLLSYATFMFMRDILAPAFAGNVFKMTVSERSALQTTINGPILVAMIGAGLATLWIHKKYSIYGGLGLAIVGVLIQAISGLTFKVDQAALNAYTTASNAFANKTISQAEYDAARATWNGLIQGNKTVFTVGLLLMGLGLGASVPGMIGTMMDITDKANAALYIGVWGIAQAFGQGFANLGAGLLRDTAYNAFQDNLGLGYALVFGVQATGMVLATFLFTRINVAEFRRELAANQIQMVAEASIPAGLQPVADGGIAWFSQDSAGGSNSTIITSERKTTEKNTTKSKR